MAAETLPARDDVAVATVRASGKGPLRDAGAIFFVRVRTISATGRLFEEIVVPVQLRFRRANRNKRRRDVRADAQELIDRCRQAIMTTVRTHTAVRLAAMSGHYGCGLERAVKREERLAEILAGESPHLVQTGLFDRRSLKEHQSARGRESAASEESDTRRRILRSVIAGIAAQELEIVLLLLVGTDA